MFVVYIDGFVQRARSTIAEMAGGCLSSGSIEPSDVAIMAQIIPCDGRFGSIRTGHPLTK